jgi:hypothetical protein
MVQQLGDGDWRTIAEKASKEMDPEKLAIFIAQLCSALDERKARPHWQPDEPGPLSAS